MTTIAVSSVSERIAMLEEEVGAHHMVYQLSPGTFR